MSRENKIASGAASDSLSGGQVQTRSTNGFYLGKLLAQIIFLVLLAGSGSTLPAQFLPPPSLPRDTFSVEVDAAATKQMTALRDNLRAGQYAEGVALLLKLAETRSEKFLELTPGRYVTVRRMAEILAANLPPEGLRIYREQVDPAARRIVEQIPPSSEEASAGSTSSEAWNRVLRQGYAGSFADEALQHLAAEAWERGEIARARGFWEMLIPPRKSDKEDRLPTTFAYPDTDLDLAEVRAKLILCSILLYDFTRAERELTAYRTLHPESRGKLAGTEGKWIDLLQSFLASASQWQGRSRPPTSLTFTGSDARNSVAGDIEDLFPPLWSIPVTSYLPLMKGKRTVSLESPRPSTFPLVSAGRVFWADDESLFACKLADGTPLWTPSEKDHPHRIYLTPVSQRPVPADEVLEDAAAFRGLIEAEEPKSFAGLPQFTLTSAEGKLIARLRTRMTPLDTSYGQGEPGRLVCLDIDRGEGKLLWEVESSAWNEEGLGWRFEGTPVASGGRLYVGLNSTGAKRTSAVAALDLQTGERLWLRRLGELQGVGFSLNERLARGVIAVGEGTLFFETGGGGLASLDPITGDPNWIITLPQVAETSSTPSISSLLWDRMAVPVWDRGVVYVLGNEGRALLAVDAASGMLVWVRDLGLQAQWILGCRGDRVIVSGERLWGIDRQDGSIRWEIGSRDVELQACGRGILTNSAVLWPLREELLVVDHATGSLRWRLPLAPQNALASGKKQTVGGGHLTPLTGGLLISHAAGMTLFPALPAAPANLPASREPRLPVKKDPAE